MIPSAPRSPINNKIFTKAFRKYFWNYLIVETIYAAFFAEMSKKRQRCIVVNLENTFSLKLRSPINKRRPPTAT
jgi:hypothetical protein